MPKAQGSLEYIIIIVLVLAVVAIVALYAGGVVGVQKSSISVASCKQAAEACKLSKMSSPMDPCTNCNTACNDTTTNQEIIPGAVKCCKLGWSDRIYTGSQECLKTCASEAECTDPNEKCCISGACSKPVCTADSQCLSNECGTGVCEDKGTCNAHCTNTGINCGSGKTCCPGVGCKTIVCKDDSGCSSLTPPSCQQYFCNNKDDSCKASCALKKIAGCCDSSNPCPSGETCSNNRQCTPPVTSGKDSSLYSQKEAFLISDKDWKDVLSLVPVTTWTGSETFCQRGTGTPSDVCVYPTLIYHDEGTGFDADSVIYFMQQYVPSHLTIIGQTPQELDNLLIAAPQLGAGLQPSQIQRKSSADYLSYWKNFNSVVYVQDDYTLSLLASEYASIINVPLVITGTASDRADVFQNKYVICVGSVSPSSGVCGETYTLEQLQKKYVSLSSTDKIILTNPNDLTINFNEGLKPEKSVNPIRELYGKTSLASSILSSAKHELIMPVNSTDYSEIKSQLMNQVNSLTPYLVNNANGIARDNNQTNISAFQSRFSDGGTSKLIWPGFEDMMWHPIKASSDKIWRFNYNGIIASYGINDGSIDEVNTGLQQLRAFDVSEGKMIFGGFNRSSNSPCKITLYDLTTKNFTDISNCKKYGDMYLNMKVNGTRIIWTEANGKCHSSDTICSYGEDCNNYCSVSGGTCQVDANCPSGETCMNASCDNYNNKLYFYDLDKNQTEIIYSDSGMQFPAIDISLNKILAIVNDRQTLLVYDITTKNLKKINLPNPGTWLGAYGDNVFITTEKENVVDDSTLYFYNTSTDDFLLVNDSVAVCSSQCEPSVFQNRIAFTTPSFKNIFVYGMGEGLIKSFATDNVPWSLSLYKDNVYYTSMYHGKEWLFGFLTIMGSPYSIQLKAPYSYDSYSGISVNRTLDPSEYADLYGNDNIPDIAVGRIQGFTISDISSYLDRDIFLNILPKTQKVEFLAGSDPILMFMRMHASSWKNAFLDAGYNSQCSISTTNGISDGNYSCDLILDSYADQEWPPLWANNDMLHYLSHGGSNWAGIWSDVIPYLSNTLVVAEACSTCSNYGAYTNTSFCASAIRKGAIGYEGAVSTAYGGSRLHKKIIDGIYYENLTIGQAYSKYYQGPTEDPGFMFTLLGDPTIDIKPLYNLKEELLW